MYLRTLKSVFCSTHYPLFKFWNLMTISRTYQRRDEWFVKMLFFQRVVFNFRISVCIWFFLVGQIINCITDNIFIFLYIGMKIDCSEKFYVTLFWNWLFALPMSIPSPTFDDIKYIYWTRLKPIRHSMKLTFCVFDVSKENVLSQ